MSPRQMSFYPGSTPRLWGSVSWLQRSDSQNNIGLFPWTKSTKSGGGGSGHILPGQFQCLRIRSGRSVEDVFHEKGVQVEMVGDVTFADSSLLKKTRHYLGVLLPSAMLFLYEYEDTDIRTMYFRVGVNIRGALISVVDEVISVKSTLDILIKAPSKDHIHSWFQKLTEASLSNENETLEPKGYYSTISTTKKKKLGGRMSDGFQKQLRYMKESWKFPDTMKDISSQSWTFPSLLGVQNTHPQDPVIFNDHLVIDSNFRIHTMVFLKDSSLGSSSFGGPFVKCEACLTPDVLIFTMKKRRISLSIVTSFFEISKNLKWGIKISNGEQKFDVQWTSKANYEKWRLAFLKTFSFHEKDRSKASSKASSVNTESPVVRARGRYSEERFRSHSWPTYSFTPRSKDTRHSLPLQPGSRKDKTDKTKSQCAHGSFSSHSVHFSTLRHSTKRHSSCLDHPIPVIPDVRLSKVFLNSCDSISSDTSTVYDEMDHTCCEFETCFNEDRSSTPLPIRCRKTGIKKRFTESCQQFTRKLIKTDIRKMKKSTVTNSKGFGSESNLQSPFKLKVENTCENVKRRNVKGRMYIVNLWNSVVDVRSSRSEMFTRYSEANITTKIPESDDEAEYEEPVRRDPFLSI